MKKVKRRFESFAFFDHTGIVAHLEAMALKGWLLERISLFSWVYYRAEPQVAHYAVFYNHKTSELDPVRSEKYASFHELCEHAGWYYVTSYGKMQIYRNYQENSVPIETEPIIELQNIHRCAGKALLFSHLFTLALLLYYGTHIARVQNWNLISLLSNNLIVWGILIVIASLLFIVIDVANFYVWYHKARRVAKDGVFLETKGVSVTGRIAIVIFAFLFFCFYVSAVSTVDSVLLPSSLLFPIGFIAIELVVGVVRDELRDQRVAAGITFIVIVVASFVLVYALQHLMNFVTNTIGNHTALEDNMSYYDFDGKTYFKFHDTLPLTLEDLAPGDYQQYNKRLQESESMLLAKIYGYQYPRPEATYLPASSEMYYNLVVVKAPFLYTLCKNYFLQKPDEKYEIPFEDPTTTPRQYEKVDASSWGAKEAYQWTPNSSD
jgi:hypothetical protein